jgi:hypothetical protein
MAFASHSGACYGRGVLRSRRLTSLLIGSVALLVVAGCGGSDTSQDKAAIADQIIAITAGDTMPNKPCVRSGLERLPLDDLERLRDALESEPVSDAGLTPIMSLPPGPRDQAAAIWQDCGEVVGLGPFDMVPADEVETVTPDE